MVNSKTFLTKMKSGWLILPFLASTLAPTQYAVKLKCPQGYFIDNNLTKVANVAICFSCDRFYSTSISGNENTSLRLCYGNDKFLHDSLYSERINFKNVSQSGYHFCGLKFDPTNSSMPITGIIPCAEAKFKATVSGELMCSANSTLETILYRRSNTELCIQCKLKTNQADSSYGLCISTKTISGTHENTSLCSKTQCSEAELKNLDCSYKVDFDIYKMSVSDFSPKNLIKCDGWISERKSAVPIMTDCQ